VGVAVSEVDWPALATVAVTGLCLLAGVSLALSIVITALSLWIGEVADYLEGD